MIPKPTPNGFTPIAQFKAPRRLMLGIEGLPDSGKTEFAFTAPCNIGMLAIDRGYEHVVTKANPPQARQKDIFIRTFQMPQPGQDPGKEQGNTYKTIWDDFYKWYRLSLQEPSFKTIVIDGDSDTWDLQQLASFGKITQVPPIQRTDVNAARRVMISRAFDSGKNIIFTYRLKHEWENIIKMNSQGQPTEVGQKTGEYRRVGFNDQDYVVQVQLRALYDPNRTKKMKGEDMAVDEPDKFGIRILKCKPDPSLVGLTLWGAENNFTGLVQAIYPETDLAEWGL